MPPSFATKASEKQQACKKLMALLHKEYGRSVPKFSMPVLETMLFAACLEDNSWDAAIQGFDRLNKLYFDLNEVRVSSVAEIEETLSGMRNGDWAGLRIRSILRFVFETTYTYDYEKLKRLTNDSAQKRLKKVDNMSPFIRNFTVQHSLGGYLVCLDTLSARAVTHLGVVPPGLTEEQAGEFLKSGLKKADTFAFTCALRCLATDPRFIERLDEPPDEDEPFDLKLVEQRFNSLSKPKRKRRKKVEVGSKSAVKSGTGRPTVAGRRKTRKVSSVKKTANTKVGKARKAVTRASSVKRTTAKAGSARSTAVKKKVVVSKTAKKKPSAAKKKSVGKQSAVAKTATAKKAASRKKAAKKKAAGKNK